jgi:hypothetical protein
MGARYEVIVRRRGRTEKQRHDTLDAALDALETEARALATRQRPHTEKVLGREYDPAAQVPVRAELRGPGGLRAGVDVRGDGSAVAFTGRLTRRPVDPQDGEDAYAALRRVVRAAFG